MKQFVIYMQRIWIIDGIPQISKWTKIILHDWKYWLQDVGYVR
jgi:hypothetical protein